MSKVTQASVAAACASLFFGASVVATRAVIGDIEPILLAFLRYLIASLVLAPWLTLRSLGQFRTNDLIAVAALGIIGFGLFPLFFNAGLALIPASRGALWLATMPVLTLGLAAVLRIERLTLKKACGTVLTMLGIAVALGDPRTLIDGSNGRGDLLMLATACCGAVYFVLLRPLLRRLPALRVTAISMIAGTVFLGCISAAEGTLGLPHLDRAGWLTVVFLGTFGGALGFWLWIWALQRSTPTRTAVFVTLNPISAALLGALMLGEPLTVRFLLGFSCVLSGIVTAQLPEKRHHAAAAPS